MCSIANRNEYKKLNILGFLTLLGKKYENAPNIENVSKRF